MKSPEWPLAELIELHRSFIEMRQRRSIEDRRDLSFRLVLCRASMDRLEIGAIKCPPCRADLRADHLQEATLVLVETLSAEMLHYADQGAVEFGSWYWNACCHACLHAARRFQGEASKLIAFVDTESLSQVAAAPLAHEHPFDKLSRAIAHLPGGPIRNAILDWSAGLTVDESARRRGIPPRTVDWLRQRGRRLVRKYWATDATDCDQTDPAS
jgi:DNA-directed RNA polymerase specialized sigma24 family protein